jgi:hypothetical protein
MDGLGSDIQTGWKNLNSAIARAVDPVKEAKKQLPVYDGSCPPVTVRPDLRTLVEYQTPNNPAENMRISDVEIVDAKGICRVENNAIALQIDLTLEGRTGPKARVRASDKPSFAYPYFVAVTDAQGNILSKEIFAAPLAYGSNEKEMRSVETVFQTMPFPDSAAGEIYNVVVGFQLTPEQLAYNNRAGSAL